MLVLNKAGTMISIFPTGGYKLEADLKSQNGAVNISPLFWLLQRSKLQTETLLGNKFLKLKISS